MSINFEINKIIESIQKRGIFTSEADLQLEVALSIKAIYKDNVAVYREYVPDFSEETKKEYKGDMHIDILVITKDGKWIPIELKYKTKRLWYKDERTGCVFNLKEQSAHDSGCYDYLKDIKRIELIKKDFKEKFSVGYTIFITNDTLYKNGPSNLEVNYSPFAISTKSQKEAGISYEWKSQVPNNERMEELKFENNYSFDWSVFRKFEKQEVNIKKSNRNALQFYLLKNEIN